MADYSKKKLRDMRLTLEGVEDKVVEYMDADSHPYGKADTDDVRHLFQTIYRYMRDLESDFE